MNQSNRKAQESLQMLAKCALNDISNQQNSRTKSNWLLKTISRTKNRKGSLKLPQISSQKCQQRYLFKNTPLIIRKKTFLLKQKINQIKSTMQRSKDLSNYDINKKLARQIDLINKQNSLNTSVLSKRGKQQASKRYYTQPNQFITEDLKDREKIRNKINDPQNDLKRNLSFQVKKTLIGLSKMNDKNSKQIQQIKSLIEDKRIKCRKLSRQGYLICKNDSLDDLQQGFDRNVQSMEFKNNEISRFRNRQNNFPRTSLSNHSINIELKGISPSRNFLRNALQILHIKQR